MVHSNKRTNGKLTEAEIAYLMNILTPADCRCCIWREKEVDRYQCFPNGNSPCKVFADKVFYGLERSGLI